MAIDYFKKVDRSLLQWGMTLPDDWARIVLGRKKLKPGNSLPLVILWKEKTYEARFSNVRRKEYKAVYQFRWDTNKELLLKLRTAFIFSYISIKSHREKFEQTKKIEKGTHFRTAQEGGEQEVLEISPTKDCVVRFNPFIVVENKWNHLFRRLADQNVFGWLFEKERKTFIQKSYPWMPVKEFKKHSESINVIYYLLHKKMKKIYVGKADVLGNRVKPGRAHQGMNGDWDQFRYDIVANEYSGIIERIEDHTIRALSSLLKNSTGFDSASEEGFVLVNRAIRKT